MRTPRPLKITWSSQATRWMINLGGGALVLIGLQLAYAFYQLASFVL